MQHQPTCAPCRSSSRAVLFMSAMSSSLSTARFSPPPPSAAPSASPAPSPAAAPAGVLLESLLAAGEEPAGLLPPAAGVGASRSEAFGQTRASTSRASSARSGLPQASSTCRERHYISAAFHNVACSLRHGVSALCCWLDCGAAHLGKRQQCALANNSSAPRQTTTAHLGKRQQRTLANGSSTPWQSIAAYLCKRQQHTFDGSAPLQSSAPRTLQQQRTFVNDSRLSTFDIRLMLFRSCQSVEDCTLRVK